MITASRRQIVLVLLGVALLPLPARGDELLCLSADQVKQIETAIAAELTQKKIPGLSAAVAVGNRTCWSRGFGMADVENDVPARPHTVYRLGSISKPVTAVAVMQLAEAGKLDLDAPVQK